jgi:SAM-dependent methyltransferase
MENFGPGTYGERYAVGYDDVNDLADTSDTVDFLAGLAAGGPVLELAIGTGRIGLPLAGRGLTVDGVEYSPEMVEQLRAKPGGDGLDVVIGDMADVPVPGRYKLIFVVYNTLFNLTTQDEQVRCFGNVAEHLTDDGVFVLECFVPTRYQGLRDDQWSEVRSVETDVVRIETGRHDPVAQRLDKSHINFAEGGVQLHPVVLRYAWPAELDLMARLAGLTLKQRTGGWHGEPFTGASRRHVSVYGRP